MMALFALCLVSKYVGKSSHPVLRGPLSRRCAESVPVFTKCLVKSSIDPGLLQLRYVTSA